MIWLKLLLAILRIARFLYREVERRRLIAEGQEELFRQAMVDIDVLVQESIAARRAVDHSSSGMRDDPRNRGKTESKPD